MMAEEKTPKVTESDTDKKRKLSSRLRTIRDVPKKDTPKYDGKHRKDS